MNKNLKNVIYVVAIIFIVYLFTLIKQCSEPKVTVDQEVTIPEKVGDFTDVPKVTEGKSKKDSIVYMKGKTIYTENPINKKLADDYLQAKDSIQKLKLYLDAIQEKEETYTFDNKDLKLEVSTKTRGQILDLKPKYTIKEKQVTIAVPQKQTVLAMYGGLEIANNAILNNMTFKIDVGIQNRKGTIFTLGADNRSNYYVGAKVKIFDIKK
jgi:hypothetical protein